MSIVSERGESQRPKISVTAESNDRVCVLGSIMAMIAPTSVICQAVDYAVDKDLSNDSNPIDFVILTVLTVLESFTRCDKDVSNSQKCKEVSSHRLVVSRALTSFGPKKHGVSTF